MSVASIIKRQFRETKAENIEGDTYPIEWAIIAQEAVLFSTGLRVPLTDIEKMWKSYKRAAKKP